MTTAINTQKDKASLSNRTYLLKSIICVGLMFGFGSLPACGPLTPFGMKILGAFFGCLFGWIFIGLIWPSVFGLIALVLSGAFTLPEVFANGWGSTTELLIFFTMVLTLVVDHAGVSKFLAMFLISRKWVLGRPWVFTLIFLYSVLILSAVTSTLPAIMLSWSILYNICTQVGYKPFDRYPTFMTIAIVVTATLGLALFPFKIVALTVFGVLENIAHLKVDYLAYLCFTIPMGIMCTALFTFVCKVVFKIDVSLLKNLTEESFKDVDLTLNKRQKYILWSLIIMIILFLLPSVLPKSFILSILLSTIQPAGIAALTIAILCALKIDGKPLMDFKETTSKGMQWDVLFITATTLPLSNALTIKEAGITPFLLNVMGPAFEGKTFFVFLVIAIIAAVVITQFAANNLTGAIMLPVFYPFAVKLGISPLVLSVLLIYAVHFALLTPAASPMASIMHGNMEWLKPKDIYKYSLCIAVSCIAALCIIGIPYASLIIK